MENNMPTDKELQEKALYDIVQYLPLDELEIRDYDDINTIIEEAKIKAELIDKTEGKLSKEDKSIKKAIEDNLPTIQAILKDNPELGKAKISNMSWEDNDNDGKQDHNPKGMQACTFERGDQVYISFRGTPRKSWLDNAKAFVEDLKRSEVIYNVYTAVTRFTTPPLFQLCGEVWKQVKKVLPWEDMTGGIKGKISSVIDPKDNVSTEKINGVFDSELKKYTSPMQEEAIDYVESLKNPADGKKSVFDKYDNVYVTGHSKGGNEATLVTMIYSDVIDRCISGDGQGFSPEFVEYMKKAVGDEGFAEIQDKMYGFHANNDYVNPLGVSVIKEENKIYFIPEIKLESIFDLLWNHLPTAMINPKTGKIAQISEQGAFGKFIGSVSDKIMKMNPRDREDASITAMMFLQYFYVGDIYTSVNPDLINGLDEVATDMADISESFVNGIIMLVSTTVKTLAEPEGKELVNYLVDTFYKDSTKKEEILKVYDNFLNAVEKIDKFNQFLGEFARDLKSSLDEFKKSVIKYNEQVMGINSGLENLKKLEVYGATDLGVVAINYEKTKELVNILDEANDLVEIRLLPEMEDISEKLKSLSFWKVNTRDWDDIIKSIKSANDKRKMLKERVIHYYNSCESMETKFVSGMNGVK